MDPCQQALRRRGTWQTDILAALIDGCEHVGRSQPGDCRAIALVMRGFRDCQDHVPAGLQDTREFIQATRRRMTRCHHA